MATPDRNYAGEKESSWEETLPPELQHLKNSPIHWTAFVDFIQGFKENTVLESSELGTVVKGEMNAIRLQVEEITGMLTQLSHSQTPIPHPEGLGGSGQVH